MVPLVHIVLLCALLLPMGACSPLRARTHYIDPRNGNSSGDGTRRRPWRTLQEIIEGDMVKTRSWETLPYSPGVSLKVKNPEAPVGPGDTLLLLDGYHGKVAIQSAYNKEPITIMSAEGHTARLGRLSVVSGSKWILKGLSISPEYASSYEQIRIVQIESHRYRGPSREVVVEDCDVFSVADISKWSASDWRTLSCNGIHADGNAITIRNNRLRNVNFGIYMHGDSSLIEGNTVSNFAGDGMRGLGNDLVFQYNLIKNCYKVNSNHDDGFQSWSRGPDGAVGRGTVYRITLRGNTIVNYEDPRQPFRGTLQGIGCFDGMFEDWVVENNLIITDHWHGISLYGARNCRVINNTVCDPNATKPGPPWIKIRAHKNKTPASDCIVRNNLAGELRVDHTAGDVDNNIVIGNPELLFADSPRGDYRLRRGSRAIDAGSAEHAPPVDIRGVRRPQGTAVDIGAYEWMEEAPSGRRTDSYPTDAAESCTSPAP